MLDKIVFDAVDVYDLPDIHDSKFTLPLHDIPSTLKKKKLLHR